MSINKGIYLTYYSSFHHMNGEYHIQKCNMYNNTVLMSGARLQYSSKYSTRFRLYIIYALHCII
jgi:hypothetical protein